MIDRYLLRYFLAVIDHGNFTRAAERCNVTQSTLSLGIARLEALVGQRLFRRSNRRVDLLPAGVRFAEHAREIELAFQRAERVSDTPASGALIRLGILNTVPASIIAGMARAILAPGDVQLELIEGRARELGERLSLGRIDAALTLDPGTATPGFAPVHHESYSMALPASHPYAGQASIDGAALADNVMIVRRHCEALTRTSQYFTQRGVRPFFAARTTRDDQALAYVAAGVGVTVMPDCFAAADVVRVPLAGFDAARTLGIMGEDTPLRQRCIDAARVAFAAA